MTATLLRTSRSKSCCDLSCKIRALESPTPILSAKSSNFRRLVLCCIKADFCDQIFILQHFARSRRYAILCTAQISKFQQKVGKKFRGFLTFFQISAKNHYDMSIYSHVSLTFASMLMKFSCFISGASPAERTGPAAPLPQARPPAAKSRTRWRFRPARPRAARLRAVLPSSGP